MTQFIVEVRFPGGAIKHETVTAPTELAAIVVALSPCYEGSLYVGPNAVLEVSVQQAPA